MSLILALMLFVLAVVIVIFEFYCQRRPPSHLIRVISQSGKKTNYFIGKNKDHKVYFNFWSGDFLGRFHQVELSGAVKDAFTVIDLRVVFNVMGEQVIAVGKSNNNYYFDKILLPFDLGKENLTGIFWNGRTVFAFVTDKQVYFKSRNDYVGLSDADPKSIRLADDEVRGDFLRDNENFFRYSYDTESMQIVKE